RKVNTLCDRLMLMGYIEEKHAFGEAEVKEVIGDIQREMSYPEHLNVSQDGSKSILNDTFATELETRLLRLDERVSDLERSVTTVLKLLREILSLASVRRLRNEDL
ncbi:MAG TPA: hypothetical protein VM532_16990, partial [Burkholderiales bacterium]|nr:hypothetical protein [Burkholderiales bacterium]